MTTTQKKITDDLEAMLSVLPPEIARAVQSKDNFDKLLEVILDLGRLPTARFVDAELPLSEQLVTQFDLDYVTERIGDFDADNRAGMERTLHRISAIRNRRGKIVGLTCRVGRAVYGTIDIIADLVHSGQSILILGKPGVGKTTMLREAARILAETRRVVIVDTSNEIGGDGDVPHPAVGAARRMQVPRPSLQHEVMIEAVENHNPEVIVIDEIGRELEAQAARTIAERGVQLIGTAHGNSLENLLLNPTLSDLIGGIESVTLSDDEARRRGTQKTVLERRAPPTFDVLVEIQSRQRLTVHRDVSAAVDLLLRGFPAPAEERYWDEKGGVHIQSAPQPAVTTAAQSLKRGGMEKAPFQRGMNHDRTKVSPTPAIPADAVYESVPASKAPEMKNIYAFGIARNRLLQRIRSMGVPARLVRTLEEADTFVTQRRYYRERLQPVVQAEEQGVSIFVIKSNSDSQIEQFLSDLFMLPAPRQASSPYLEALEEADDAVQMVLTGEKYVDLRPASADVRKGQHQLAEKANLSSESFGTEPHRFVRIFRD